MNSSFWGNHDVGAFDFMTKDMTKTSNYAAARLLGAVYEDTVVSLPVSKCWFLLGRPYMVRARVYEALFLLILSSPPARYLTSFVLWACRHVLWHCSGHHNILVAF